MIVLPLNQKDDDYTGQKKWNQIINDDGTSSFEDATEYKQKGDDFGAVQANKMNAAIMGFSSSQTTFPTKSTVLEVDAGGKKKKTTFGEGGKSIYEALYDENDTFLAGKTTTFNKDGSITEEVQLA